MSLGNDVVDLDDPEARIESLHPRFDERVFTRRERAVLFGSPQRQRLHWSLWAAKESAFKAQRRLAPETVYAPREYEIELSPLPAAGENGALSGRARRGDAAFALDLQFAGAAVHAVARAGGERTAPFLWQVARETGDPGLAVRRLVAAAIGPVLGLDPLELRIVDRPPRVLHRGLPLDVMVSLSHHGRFVAFVARAAGRTGGGPRHTA